MRKAHNAIDLTGRIFHKWTVLSKTDKKVGKYDPVWLCKCACGTLKNVSSNSLRNGSKSCGCLLNESKGRPLGKESSYIKAMRQTYARYRIDARKRNLKLNITFEHFLELTKLNCFYCNKEPSNCVKYKNTDEKFSYNGIDRVDNTEGYESSNVVSCCRVCNGYKKSVTPEMVRKIYKFLFGSYE
jgi:hypothetical protein